MPAKAIGALLALLFTSTLAFSAEHFVYTATNSATENALVIYHQAADGTLQFSGTNPTQGRGSGGTIAPLQSQNSILLDPTGSYLFAVNAGSGTISSFTIAGANLQFSSQVPSGGVVPVSLTIHGNLLYVLNAGDDSISGFSIGTNGQLSPIPNSTLISSDYVMTYGANTRVSTIQFDPSGKHLYVSNIATFLNKLFTGFIIGASGTPTEFYAPAVDTTNAYLDFLYGFVFTPQGFLVAPGQSNYNALFSDPQRALLAFSESVATGYLKLVEPPLLLQKQSQGRYVTSVPSTNYVYISHSESESVSGLAVDATGKASLIGTTKLATSSFPLDIAASSDGQFLYVLDAFLGGVRVFRIGSNGTLSAAGSITDGLQSQSGEAGLAIK